MIIYMCREYMQIIMVPESWNLLSLVSGYPSFLILCIRDRRKWWL